MSSWRMSSASSFADRVVKSLYRTKKQRRDRISRFDRLIKAFRKNIKDVREMKDTLDALLLANQSRKGFDAEFDEAIQALRDLKATEELLISEFGRSVSADI